MTGSGYTFTPSDDCRLQLHTGVTGKASKMGHRLTIAVTRWRAEVEWSGDRPAGVELSAEVDSIDVVGGEGGVTPLLGPEKAIARSNALKTFDADRFPHIGFRTHAVDETDDGYRLSGTLEIHGVSREHTVDLIVEDLGGSWGLSAETVVRQSDFGIKPYSQLMGAMKVVDDVTVGFAAQRPKRD
ncbi:YceI family protein [Williamsia phyllosphaerae]|uniref:Polyisoprenoid-binding protein n=1 Tax=Williamsia phyllosphaerae TaxID=885042 RepID=A0ABQ1V7V8_9NOCA|nr:YceI family protein [Williamsia phyllosphaerae]GGF43097.1 polyisoprenoid-binding protein [Williamsia phyllosphaerae]